MLNLPRLNLDKIKRDLLRRQKQVEQQLQSIEREDPVMAAGLAVGASESGTDSWLAEAHGRLTTLKNDLKSLSGKIAYSLTRLKRGTYGKCENCGKMIEAERLEVLPTATLCLSCSKKASKK